MSYTIDIYRGRIRPTPRYFDLLLYVSYFPQLIAGPIERSERLLPQIVNCRRRLSTGDLVDGIKLIIIGFFQKVAIADTLAPISDRVFSAATGVDSLTLMIGLYAFAIQIYCDFSGYSKMARGTSRLLGIRLVKNFDQPYFSRNAQEFWGRWHISLSTWLRDYLYIPLGGSRRGRARTYSNLMIVMLLGGLWHGASWNFVLWGGIHGLFLIWCHIFPAPKNVLSSESMFRRWVRIILTFHVIAYTWIFFRTDGLFDPIEATLNMLQLNVARPDTWMVVYVVVYGLLVFALDSFLEEFSRRNRPYMICLFSRNWVIETTIFTALLLATFLIGGHHAEPFIYFQF